MAKSVKKYKRQTHYVRTKYNEALAEYCEHCGQELDKSTRLSPAPDGKQLVCRECFTDYSWMPCEVCGHWTFIDKEHKCNV